jgi:hypothetical protein
VVAAAGIGLLATAGEPTGRTAAIGFALLMIALGAYEGLGVGWMQWRVLRSPLPDAAPAIEVLLALLLGAVAGTILASPRARVLRQHVARAWLWLPANALAWALGMVVVFRFAGTLPPSAGPAGS